MIATKSNKKGKQEKSYSHRKSSHYSLITAKQWAARMNTWFIYGHPLNWLKKDGEESVWHSVGERSIFSVSVLFSSISFSINFIGLCLFLHRCFIPSNIIDQIPNINCISLQNPRPLFNSSIIILVFCYFNNFNWLYFLVAWVP